MNKKIKTYLLITLAFLVMLSIFIIVFTNKETIKHITISQLRDEDEEVLDNSENELSVGYEVYDYDISNNIYFLVKIDSDSSLEYVKCEDDFEIDCNNRKSISFDYNAPRNSEVTLLIKEENKEEVEKSFTVETTYFVKSVTLNKTSLSLDWGKTATLVATVGPANADDKTLTWSSSNTSVATVNQNGLVTAVSSGSATITATANDGSGKKATCNVEVGYNYIVKNGTLVNKNYTVLKGGSVEQKSGYVKYTANNEISYNGAIYWYFSDYTKYKGYFSMTYTNPERINGGYAPGYCIRIGKTPAYRGYRESDPYGDGTYKSIGLHGNGADCFTTKETKAFSFTKPTTPFYINLSTYWRSPSNYSGSSYFGRVFNIYELYIY